MENLTEQQRKSITVKLNIARMVCTMILIAYALPTQEWLLSYVGGLPCLLAVSYMLIPRKIIWWSIKEAMKDED